MTPEETATFLKEYEEKLANPYTDFMVTDTEYVFCDNTSTCECWECC